MKKTTFNEASRAQMSFLAPLEKKALLWLAQRMPRWVNSDHLTVLGLLALMGAGIAYWYTGRDIAALNLVSVLLVINWFGDSLDGTLARVRNCQRPRYGFYVDHVVDAVGTLFLMGGVGLSTYMSPAIGFGLLIVYLLLSIESYLTTYAIGTFHISFWKFSPTELRVLLIVGNTYLLLRPAEVMLAGHKFLLFDVGGFIGILGMTLMLVTSVVKHTIQLYREEPLP